MQDPKPCPFCGHETPAVSDGNNGLHFRVICGKGACRAAGPLERCAIDAVNEWNKRAAATEIEHLQSQLNAMASALRPFAALAAPKTWADAPGEAGPSRIDLLEGKDGTGELYLGTHFGTAHTITLYRDDFDQAFAALKTVEKTR